MTNPPTDPGAERAKAPRPLRRGGGHVGPCRQAHRPGRGLDPAHFDCVLAVDPRDQALWKGLTIPVRPIRSIASEQFRNALADGHPLYDVETLRAYVRDDLEVIEETAPDVVVGDFRLSLAVSTRVTATPYMAITNAYWSPYGRQRFPMPELPIARHLGLPIARRLFGLARPFAFAYHTLPLNRVRREYGLPGLGLDLRRVYTEADCTLYADVPEMVPTFGPARQPPLPWPDPLVPSRRAAHLVARRPS